MKKIAVALLVVLLAIGVTAFIRLSSTGNVDSGSSNEIAFEDLVKHNSDVDCWVGYNGNVYDVTSWLPNHPGSAGAISPYCGTYEEFTQAFTNKHGTTQVSMLMKVGTIMGDFEIKGSV